MKNQTRINMPSSTALAWAIYRGTIVCLLLTYELYMYCQCDKYQNFMCWPKILSSNFSYVCYCQNKYRITFQYFVKKIIHTCNINDNSGTLWYSFRCERNMNCLGDVKLKKTYGNWNCIYTDLKSMYTCTLFTLYVSLSLVTMFILSRVFFLN